jgi:two-component system chemotaxis response regulator CheV
MDLGMALGKPPVQEVKDCFMIITEYNRNIQGFLVDSVDRIINMKWESILPPPAGVGSTAYLTAVTHVDDELVEIIDVEKVLAEVSPIATDISEGVNTEKAIDAASMHVLVADDSGVARKQITRTLDQLQIKYFTANNGREALDILKEWAKHDPTLLAQTLMVITDIEMPEMDGYTLTSNIKKDPQLQGLHVMLHSSLSGVFNQALVEKVGADNFLPKYSPDDLATTVLKRLEQVQEAQKTEAA